MVIVLVLTCFALLLVIFTGRPPSGPDGLSQGAQLEAYLQEVDRRQKQLRRDHLDDW